MRSIITACGTMVELVEVDAVTTCMHYDRSKRMHSRPQLHTLADICTCNHLGVTPRFQSVKAFASCWTFIVALIKVTGA